MIQPTLVLAALLAFQGGAPEDGQAWLKKVEDRLYHWPKPGVVVRFQVRTNMIDEAVGILRKELQSKPDPATAQAIEALKQVTIRGSIDTGTGAVTTDVDVPLQTDDPARKAGVERLKNGIRAMVSGAFQGLPLHDPSMLGKGSSVVSAEADGDSIAITITGRREGERNTIRVDRRSVLPEAIETPVFSLRYRYFQVLPGRFVPAHLEVRTRSGPANTADYTYQKVGDLVFPASVQVTSGELKATLQFESVSPQPRTR